LRGTQQEYADNKENNAGEKADVEDKVRHEVRPTMIRNLKTREGGRRIRRRYQHVNESSSLTQRPQNI